MAEKEGFTVCFAYFPLGLCPHAFVCESSTGEFTLRRNPFRVRIIYYKIIKDSPKAIL